MSARTVTPEADVVDGTYTDADLRPLLGALIAMRDGDFRHRLEDHPDGILAEIATAVRQTNERAQYLSSELARVHKAITREGRLDERLLTGPLTSDRSARVQQTNALLDAVISVAKDLTRVIEAVADGDVGQRANLELGGRPLRGDLRRMGKTVNRMADHLTLFTSELTQVAHEVGTAGRLGGRARTRGLQGRWRETIDAVNTMAVNLTAQVRDIAQVTTSAAKGDLSRKVTVDAAGELLDLKLTVNTMVDQLSAFAGEVTRVAREVGTEGQLGGRARVRGTSGVWAELTESVNQMASNLTYQVRNISQVATAVAMGDLTKKIDVDARGEILQLKTTVNTMVDQLSAFGDEVTRVAREVGTEGRLGGRAEVKGVSGVWKDLTNNVNSMADNLTSQVRNIAQVTTAVAQGDLTKKIDVDARGEILELKTTINTMVDQLSAFAGEVTRVAREVGTEGRLGAQAEVEGVSGTWKRLTDNVNILASNLTTQVRAIGEVARAVASGDLTPSITVEAQGEVAELKDNVNLMVTSLRETTRAKDWLESNLARIAALMKGHRDLVEVAELILGELTPLVSAQYGAFFLTEENADGEAELSLIAGYGSRGQHGSGARFRIGEGLVGQAAVEKRRILIKVPAGYLTIRSGLGEAPPAHIVMVPIVFEDQLLGVIELAAFTAFSEVHLAFFDQFVHTIGVAINTIVTNARTEKLLGESQRLTRALRERSEELERRQAELRRTNTELADKAALLADKNQAIEIQNFQIEQARRSLEERAEQLALSSRYKSEFLANMSHELRTPLNSMLILAQMLADNTDSTLSPKQVEFASTIHRAGTDLRQMIDDVLDLAKVEAGRMDIHPLDIPMTAIVDYVKATFGPLATGKDLVFQVDVSPQAPAALHTDEQRVRQILRNLLSNAIKFTAKGEVRLSIAPSENDMVAFAVSDTGVGIPADKLRLIFEAFQQADGTTNRKYGGTGLGLSISRDIVSLMGGDIRCESVLGKGSTFTVRLPVQCIGTSELMRPENASFGMTFPGESAVLPGTWPEPLEGPNGADPAAPGTDLVAPGANAPGPSPAPGIPAVPTFPATPGSLPFHGTDNRSDVSGGSEQAIEEVFADRKILIVDDDVRNVFALTSALERRGLEIAYAENGREGLERLRSTDNIALILMDVMMPEMDGYEAMRAIRQMPQYAETPIIAVTAKAMPSDRDRCLAAGASDYIAKPVDVNHLLSVMRVHMKRLE